MLCLLPSEGPAKDKKAPAKDSSDDSEDADNMQMQGNLEPSKAIQAYIRVSKMTSELGARPKSNNIVRSIRKSKPIRKN